MILLAVGFIPMLVFAWVFELTPEGIKRDEDVKPEESIAPQTARRMDRLIIAVLICALVYFGFDKFVLAPRRDAALVTQTEQSLTARTAASQHAQNDKSIAVLPFENLSEDKSNAYFASGMQDEILTRLAGIHDLKVISRTSTEQYASHPPNLKIVAEQLGVATVLEGSVQRADGKVRINLQLIDARSDSHLWAQNYDRDLKDVFAVQSDVAEKVADALKAQLLPAEAARIVSVPTQSLHAHDLFLQGRFLFNQLQNSTVSDPIAIGKRATDLLDQAIAADPKFALAYAQLALLKMYLHWYGVDNDPALVDAARRDAERALALQPNLPEAHLAMGYVHYWGHRDYAAALREFTISRTSMPNNSEAIAAIGYVKRRQGDADLGITELEQASTIDPHNTVLRREIANSKTLLRQYQKSDVDYVRALAIEPANTEALVQRATSMMMQGDTASAERVLAGVPPGMDPEGSVSLMRFRLQMLLRKPDAALAVLDGAPNELMSRFEHSLAPAALLRGQALAMKGDSSAARTAFLQAEQQLQQPLDNPVTAANALSFMGLVNAGLGRKPEALAAGRAAVEKLQMARDFMVGGYMQERLARVEAQVGETDAAIGHLRQLLDAPAGSVISVSILRIDPAWDPLRKNPRFQALLELHAN